MVVTFVFLIPCFVISYLAVGKTKTDREQSIQEETMPRSTGTARKRSVIEELQERVLQKKQERQKE